MSCFTEVDETKNYYAFRVRDPSNFDKNSFKTPEWARHVAESVVEKAFVTMGILKKSKKWAVQAIKVPLEGRTTRQARKLAMQIAAKLRTCPEAISMFPTRKRVKGCPG